MLAITDSGKLLLLLTAWAGLLVSSGCLLISDAVAREIVRGLMF